jgi:hypothetical protein
VIQRGNIKTLKLKFLKFKEFPIVNKYPLKLIVSFSRGVVLFYPPCWDWKFFLLPIPK